MRLGKLLSYLSLSFFQQRQEFLWSQANLPVRWRRNRLTFVSSDEQRDDYASSQRYKDHHTATIVCIRKPSPTFPKEFFQFFHYPCP